MDWPSSAPPARSRVVFAAAHVVADPAAGDGRHAPARLDWDATLVPLARHIFAAPTRYYKTGVTFLAWLSGYQDQFVMLGGQQDARDRGHLAELFRLAADAGLFPDARLAAGRMRSFLQ
jgi:hypothetical protein